MNTLIIPAAGRSSRYPKMKPKWMLTHPDGLLMIEHVLYSMNYKSYNKTIIAILKEHCDKYEADTILKQIFNNTVELVILTTPTSSPVETIVKAINKTNIKGQIVIKDSDGVIECDLPMNTNHVVGMSVNSKSPIDKIQSKSFIIKNDDNIVLDIVEKQMVSNVICLGIYSLNSEEIISSYENIINSDVYIHLGEMYISHIVSYLINCENVIFEYIETKKFTDWGTKNDWMKEQQKYKTYFFDIDGVLLQNSGKWGIKNWYNSFEPIHENFKTLKKISDAGGEIIFVTSRNEDCLEKFKQYLKEIGIKYKTIIPNCNHSQRVIINDFAPTNPYPSCKAISIKRNSILEDYLI